MKEKLLEIINHYGLDHQLRKLHEEYYELDEAIFNYEQVEHLIKDNDSLDRKHVIEELGDVYVMLLQIQLNYDITDEELADTMYYKINRTINEIKKE